MVRDRGPADRRRHNGPGAEPRYPGEDWFIGTINNSELRQLQIPLSFLTAGKAYVAHIYADDPAVQTHTQVGIQICPVDAKTVLDVPMRPGGGQAMWITPSPAP